VKRISILSFLVPICLLLVVTGIYLASRKEPVFLLKSIKVKGASQLTEAEILKRAYPHLSDSIFKTDMDKVRQAIADHPFVKEVRVKRVYPFSILIDVKERIPSALWVTAGGEIKVLDEDGRTYRGLSKRDDKSLLLINTAEKDDARSVFRQVSTWDERGILKKDAISEVAYRNGNVTVFNIEDGVEIVLGKEDQNERLKRALAVLNDAKKRGLIIKCIDARFEAGAIVKEKVG
jgi:cell division protein FtsQ